MVGEDGDELLAGLPTWLPPPSQDGAPVKCSLVTPLIYATNSTCSRVVKLAW